MIAHPPNRQKYLKSDHTKVIKPKATAHTSVVYPGTTTLAKSCHHLVKLNMHILHGPAIPLLGLYI